MSIKLSQSESIVREYKYAKKKRLLKTTEESLVVTNKRIIRRTEGHGLGISSVSNVEMPIKNATYVTTTFSAKSKFLLLILGIIFAVIGLITIAAAISAEEFGIAIFGIIFIALCVLSIFLFIKKKIYTCYCLISTDTRINNVFSLGAISYRLLTGKATGNGGMLIKITVNGDTAREMTEELGSVITDVNEGNI